MIQLLRRKLEGGAIYYAVFISFILCSISALFLYTSQIHNQYANYYLQQDRLKDNNESALRLVMVNPSIVPFDEKTVLDVFNDQEDSVTILKTHWGAYTNWEVSSVWSGSTFTKYFMTGVNFHKGDPIALYLIEKDNYLSISGSTYIEGNAYLPKGGILKTNIEGSGFSHENFINGEKFHSSRNLSQPDNLFVKYLSKWLNGKFVDSDSILNFKKALHNGFFYNSFSQKPLILYSNDEIVLDNGLVLTGNIIVYSSKKIIIQNNSKLNTCLLFAPVIKFMERFSGNVQAFARDTVFVGEGCKITYPGYIGLLNDKSENCVITIEKGASIEGGIFLWQIKKAFKEPYLLIDNGSEIYGQVYCNGNIELKGTVIGSIYCNGFTLHTPSSFYENHLLNSTISFRKLPKAFAGYDATSKITKQNLVQCLE